MIMLQVIPLLQCMMALIAVLQEMRNGDATKVKASRREKLQIEPGKSVGSPDLPSTSADKNLEDRMTKTKKIKVLKKKTMISVISRKTL